MFSTSQNAFDRQKSSLNMLDLHIYVVPPELWEEQQNLAFNEIINETISAGFIRINADTLIGDVRMEIDETLGYHIIPKDYVFCKSVGRCLAQVQEKQENTLKVKHFLPPNWQSPELFVVDRIVIRHSHGTSESSKTRMSSTYSYANGPDPRSGQPNQDEFSTREEYKEDTFLQLQRKQNLEREKLEADKADFRRENEKFNYENENGLSQNFQDKKMDNLDRENFKPDKNDCEKDLEQSDDVNRQELSQNLEDLKISNDRKLEIRRKEIGELQLEIIRRHKELENLEKEHQMKLSALEADEEIRKIEEESRRKMFEQMEKDRRKQEEVLINKQRKHLKVIEEVIINKQQEIKESEQKLFEEKENRLEVMETKRLEMKELKSKANKDNTSDPNTKKRIAEIQDEIDEMDMKIREFEEATHLERKVAETEVENAKAEFETLKSNWNEESKHRDQDYAERISEEQRFRKLSEQKRVEYERQIEEERIKMKEERERFEEEQSHWEKEKMRYESEERRRLEDVEAAIEDVVKNKPEVQQFEIKDPDLSVKESPENEQIKNLNKVLMSKVMEREEAEKLRFDALKKIRTSQLIIQDRRNQIREVWKKKYFEEKRKTSPLEEQLNRYKEEIELLHKKVLAIIESGLRENQKQLSLCGMKSPSTKANLILQAIRIQYDINDLQQKVEHAEMRLSAEIKLRAHTETELKITRMEATQNKIRLSRTRADQMAIMAAGKHAKVNLYEYTQTPRFVHAVETTDKSNQHAYNSLIV